MRTATIIVSIILLAALSGCNTYDPKKACCGECVNAFSRSPVAVGPSGAVCARFNTAEQITQECEEYFKNNILTVQACNDIASQN